MAKITIFGLAGTGSTTVGQTLAKKLNYEFMSTGNIFRQMAKDKGLTLNELDEIAKTDEKYDRELDEVRVVNYSKDHHNFVMESRLAWYFIPDSFKIRLYCEDEERLKRVVNREDKTIEKVKEETEHREEAIYKRYKNLYGVEDINDPNNFDLNIDTTNTDVENVSQKIIDFINNSQK